MLREQCWEWLSNLILARQSLPQLLHTKSVHTKSESRLEVWFCCRSFPCFLLFSNWRLLFSLPLLTLSQTAKCKPLQSAAITSELSRLMSVNGKLCPNLILFFLSCKGQADPLNSAFHLTYNMVLNLLRVEEVNPEIMLEKSFYQFQNYASVPGMIESKYINRLID